MDIIHANDYQMALTHIRLFHRLFYKLSMFYASNVPKVMRKFIDLMLLIQASLSLFLLLYVHRVFLSHPGTCLDPYISLWPRNGIFRVGVDPPINDTGTPGTLIDEDRYVMEYSLHYSYLRMDEGLRKNMSINVFNISLARNNTCFGNILSRTLLSQLFGFDDVLMSSFKKLAANVSNKGFLRNVVTGEHYRFIDIWLNKLNYILSFALMIILTSVISMLMRLCHHQLFKFFCKLLFTLQNHVLYPVWMPFPIASLMTMFLGLWGLETIMTELLDDPMVSFHLIAFVWMADNYYTICCHNYLSKKYFPRFFYLSSFIFYAFHNQFNGQFSGLALVTTLLTTQFTMLYFYHHYELPIVEILMAQLRNNNNNQTVQSLEQMVTDLVALQENSRGRMFHVSQGEESFHALTFARNSLRYLQTLFFELRHNQAVVPLPELAESAPTEDELYTANSTEGTDNDPNIHDFITDDSDNEQFTLRSQGSSQQSPTRSMQQSPTRSMQQSPTRFSLSLIGQEQEVRERR